MWTIILALLLIGLALIVIEVIFIPGTTVVGILGFVFAVAGIIVSYRHFGSEIGFYILIGASVITLGTLIYAFRSGVWSRFSLKSSIKSKVNEGITDELQVGEIGKTVSTLRPVGKAEFNNREYEVKTSGNYLDPGIQIKVTQISYNQIVVEPIN